MRQIAQAIRADISPCAQVFMLVENEQAAGFSVKGNLPQPFGVFVNRFHLQHPQQLPNIGHRPGQAGANATGANGAVFKTSPAAQSLLLVQQVVRSLPGAHERAGFQFQRWELCFNVGCSFQDIHPFQRVDLRLG